MSKNHEKAAALIKELESVLAKEEVIIDDYTAKTKPFHDKLELEIAPYRQDTDNKLKPLATRREEITKEVLALGGVELQKLNDKKASLFTDDNWKFEDHDHYLHIKREAEVKTSNDFELWKFIKKHADYVKVQYKIAELKKIFVDTKLAKPFIKMGLSIKTVPSVELKKSKSN